ncbi:unnamed protein product [Brassica oleracea var. botrytis]|uniref:Uncharacterized protein n=1 Tax=Brassica oleracea TaxID=3712 RepID=A0A3P6C4V0_BRAOL|nr:unnamed protein product [Brassica oleracea]
MWFSVVGGKWLAEKNKIKASVAGTGLWKWLAVKSQKNKIKALQKAIDKLNKADKELKLANQYEKHAPAILERKKLYELVVLEKAKKKEIDALHNGDFITHICLLCVVLLLLQSRDSHGQVSGLSL